ncbi:MAG: hypothetical protein VB913_16790 [Rhodospirillales bacterium]
MSEVYSLESAGYKYLKGVFQYSAGVASHSGFEIERARFKTPLPLNEGFAAIEAHLRSLGRPVDAFCACELRSPEPFTEESFEAFNRDYVSTLEDWDILRDGNNPIARSNVCPERNKPETPSFYAFSYTIPTPHQTKTCVISGSAEMPEGKSNYRDHVVRLGEQSPEAMLEKARWVLAEMERRMSALDFTWSDVTATQLYTVYDVHSFLGDEIVARGAMPAGLTWHFARPPVDFVDYEMDVRSVRRERVIG